MKHNNIEYIGVLSVESDMVGFTVVSTRCGSEIVTSAEAFPLITGSQSEANIDDGAGPRAAGTRMGPGHVEQDADAIWEAVLRVIDNAVDKLSRDGTPLTYIKSVAIVNEMATVVAWNAVTGDAVHNAIHWTDVRMVDGGTGAAAQWLIRHSLTVRCAAQYCRFGTLDAWLTWKLTAGHTYRTDVTNASYTGLLDLATLCWDKDATRDRGLKDTAWPSVRKPSGRSTGAVITVGRLKGLSVHVTIARPGAVLYAQSCYHRGQVAVTLGDRTVVALGAFDRGVPRPRTALGPTPVIGYAEPNMSDRNRPKIVYGLLAASGGAGAAVRWLYNMGLVRSSDDCMDVYGSGNADLPQVPYMVPAFGGLPWAPHGRPDARPVVCGIGEGVGREHLITAAVNSICHSVDDAVRCVVAGSVSKRAQPPLYVDGSCAGRAALMRRLSDVTGHRLAVTRLDMAVTGAARMVAAAINVNYADMHDTVRYEPTSTAEQRSVWHGLWAKAVDRSYGWEAVDDWYAASAADPTGVSASIALLANTARAVGTWYSGQVYRLYDALCVYFARETCSRDINPVQANGDPVQANVDPLGETLYQKEREKALEHVSKSDD